MAAHTYTIVTKPAVCRRKNCNAKTYLIQNGDGQQVISCPIDEAAAPICLSHCISYHPEHPTWSSMTRTVCDSILRNTDNDVNVHKDYCI